MTDPHTAVAAARAPMPEAPPETAPRRAPMPALPPGRPFRKGESGNRRGAPPRPPFRTAQVEALMGREFDVEIGGERRRLPLAEALLLQLAHRALAGDLQASDQLIRLMGEVERVRRDEARRRADRVRAARADRKAEQAKREATEAKADLAREMALLRAGLAFERPSDDSERADHATLRAATLLQVVEGCPDGSDPQAWADGDPRGGRPTLRIADWALEAARENDPAAPVEAARGWHDAARTAELLEALHLARRPDPWSYGLDDDPVFRTPPRRLPRWLIDAALERTPDALDEVDEAEDADVADVLEGGLG